VASDDGSPEAHDIGVDELDESRRLGPAELTSINAESRRLADRCHTVVLARVDRQRKDLGAHRLSQHPDCGPHNGSRAPFACVPILGT
jgi:hypothetical protein